MSERALLDVSGLGVSFGGVRALERVHMRVSDGSVHGLIGPNGAGKTTLLNCITRLVRPSSGSIRFLGKELLELPAHEVVRLGLARTFQNFGLMDDLSVIDNLVAGLHSVNPCSLLDELIRLPRRNRAEREMRAIALQRLSEAGLHDVRDVPVRQLPYGRRKALELARSLALQPRLLLLDEPTAGLSDAEMAGLSRSLATVRRESSTTLVIISHHMEFLLGIADQVTVLHLGQCIASGTPSEIQKDAAVIAAYLGSED